MHQLLLLLTIATLSPIHSFSFNRTIAVQSTNETFYTYLPLLSTCNYTIPGLLPGGVNETLLPPSQVLNTIDYLSSVTFWGTIDYGVNMMIQEDQLLNSTIKQVVLFNSSIEGDFSTREIILVSYVDGIIQMTYATPKYNYTTTQLTATTINTVELVPSDELRVKIAECNTFHQDGLQIVAIGNEQFLAYCPNTTLLFSFSMVDNGTILEYESVPLLTTTIQNVTNNPNLLLNSVDVSDKSLLEDTWNVVIEPTNQWDLLFCYFNGSSIECGNYTSLEFWLELVAQQAWGLQAVAKYTEMRQLLQELTFLKEQQFPGPIISIFATEDIIFVEANQSDGTVWMSVFEDQLLLVNVTLPGNVVYYGSEDLLVLGDEGYYLVSFTLPILNLIDLGQQTYQLDLVCNQRQNYTITYNILWTNIDYPSFEVVPLTQNATTIYCYEHTYISQTESDFQVIGPAFDLFIDESNTLQTTVMDYSLLSISDSILSIVDVAFNPSSFSYQVPYYFVYLTSQGELKRFSFQSQDSTQLTEPCGLNNVTYTQRINQGYLFANSTDLCMCPTLRFDSCQVIPQITAASILLNSGISSGEYLKVMSNLRKDSNVFGSQDYVKKQMFDLLGQNILVTIYEDNSVVLGTIYGQVWDNITMDCQYNETGGTIFTRNFEDDFLLLFCQGSRYIYQYFIRSKTLVFNRLVPLYGFIIRESPTILAGITYIFIEVNICPQFVGLYTAPSDNLILRLDPCADTVSVIVEIIEAEDLLLVESIFENDVVYYNKTSQQSQNSYLKVYFQSAFISFRQDTTCTPDSPCTPTTYDYAIAFMSTYYNFAAKIPCTITFDTRAAQIFTSQLIGQPVTLNRISGPTTEYTLSINYTFNDLCGPIQDYSIDSAFPIDNTIFSIANQKIVTPDKHLTGPWNPIIQLLDFETIAPDTTLAELIMVVGSRNLTFYRKFGTVYMQAVGQVESSSQGCNYFLFDIVSQDTVQLASSCYQLDTLTPMVTLTYNQSLHPQINATFGDYNLPRQLTQTYSLIPTGSNDTILFGIGQGPSDSISGILYMCHFSICNSLMIDTPISFYIDYDVKNSEEGIMIVGLDFDHVSFWINPATSSVSDQKIPANVTFSYSSIIGNYCSKVTLVNASMVEPFFIISCPYLYVALTANFSSGTLEVRGSYKKYLNCEQTQRFDPLFILDPNTINNITFLAAQCQHNQETVRLEQLQTLDSPDIIIHTAYLQIFVQQGPSCQKDEYSPLRILPTGSDNDFKVFMLYQVGTQWKMLYEYIDGVIIDNFISFVPSSFLQLVELKQEISYPKIEIMIMNEYYSLNVTLDTQVDDNSVNYTAQWAMLAVFIAFNLFTLMFLLYWCLVGKTVQRNRTSTKFDRNSETSHSAEMARLYSRRTEKSMYRGTNVRQTKMTRRVTEIELFQPR